MYRPAPHRRPTDRRRAGFSLIEAIIGMSVLMIALMAVTSTSFVVHSLEESDKARRVAGRALSAVIEEAKSTSDAARGAELGWGPTLVAAYAPGGTPGDTFNALGLSSWAAEAQVGTVQIVTDETLTDLELGVRLGMPRDLNGDGLISSADVSGSATLLPVIVRLRWSGEAGDREMVHGFYVMGY